MRSRNPRSVLVSVFRREFLDGMDFDEKERTTTVNDVEDSLQKIEMYIRAGWEDPVVPKIEAFEDEYGIDFQTLASDAPGISDPRR